MQQNASVLIVDDIPDHIAYAGNILKSDGYKVYAVTNGSQALEFVEKRIPDIIMLDIKMKGMDGLTVCEKLKANEKTQDIPIIFMTSENNPEVIKKGFALGCCDYIVKPFTKEEYLARVKAHIKISRQSKQLAAANRELEQFCSAVSHDLKSPLGVISMLAEELESDIENASYDDALETTGKIRNRTQRLTDMVDRLLEFSRMCGVTIESEPLDIAAMTKDTFDDLKALEPDRVITLKCEKIPEIFGDEVLVGMLIKNLLTNAFKFTAQKEQAIIEVSYQTDGAYHIITVSDNGAGFDMAYSDKLFKVFSRLHTSEEFSGNGVGLALCKRIIERHGGKIVAYGEVGKGARFRMFFPS